MDIDLEDIIVPANPGSLARTVQLGKVGWFRCSRRDAEFYSLLITSAGTWGKLWIYDGTGRCLFFMPSTFTGSFVEMGYAEKGIIVRLLAINGAPPVVSVNFREEDLELV